MSGDKIINLAVFVSGAGTNLQALIDEQAARQDDCPYNIAAVISDKKDAYALKRAAAAGVAAFTVCAPGGLPRGRRARIISDEALKIAEEQKIDAVILAGFLTILCGDILTKYEGRILNIHPSLLPRYGGEGMYGMRVHRAVLAAGEKQSGCTVHFVDKGCDTGEILLQRAVAVLPDDTPETLAERVHKEEHIAIADGALTLANSLLRQRGL